MTQKVLFVDDDVELIKIYALYLKKEGIEVTIANDGYEAIDMMHDIKPDLIILDVNMPHLGGMDVCEYAKSDNKLKNIPILFFSSDKSENQMFEGMVAGATEYLIKGIKPLELVKTVKSHLKG